MIGITLQSPPFSPDGLCAFILNLAHWYNSLVRCDLGKHVRAICRMGHESGGKVIGSHWQDLNPCNGTRLRSGWISVACSMPAPATKLSILHGSGSMNEVSEQLSLHYFQRGSPHWHSHYVWSVGWHVPNGCLGFPLIDTNGQNSVRFVWIQYHRFHPVSPISMSYYPQVFKMIMYTIYSQAVHLNLKVFACHTFLLLHCCTSSDELLKVHCNGPPLGHNFMRS